MKTEEKEMERKELEHEQSEKTAIGRLFHCTKRATSGFHTYPKEKQSLVSDDPNCRRLSLDTNCNIFHSKLSYAFFFLFFSFANTGIAKYQIGLKEDIMEILVQRHTQIQAIRKTKSWPAGLAANT